MSDNLTRENARIFYDYYEARDFARENVKGYTDCRVETVWPEDGYAQYRISLIHGEDVYFPKEKPKEVPVEDAAIPPVVCRFFAVDIDELDRSGEADNIEVFLATLTGTQLQVWDAENEEYTFLFDLLVRVEKVTFEERAEEHDVGLAADIVIDELVLVADHYKLGGLVVTEWLTPPSLEVIKQSLCAREVAK